MSTPTNRRYTKTHEWIALDGDVATIGITDFGDEIALDQAFGIVESVKAANDIFSPVDGEVVARNEDAVGAPETLNQSPYDRAWLVRVRVADPTQFDSLMDAAEYDAFAQTVTH